MPRRHSTTANSVATRLGVGTWIDAVVRVDGGYWFFEIKTGLSARGCLRQEVGQLLEYAFWPGAQEAQRLMVVGEAAFDDEAREYRRRLADRFELPLD